MESPPPVDVHALPPKPTPPTGFTLNGHKRLKLSRDDAPSHLAHEKFEEMTPKKPPNIEDHSNPFVTTEFQHYLDSGTFGSVTKDIVALAHKKRQLLRPFSATYPTLVDNLSKVAVKHDEQIHKYENQQVTGLAYQNVIDLECEHIAKSVPKKPVPAVVIIDSDEEDEIYQNSFVPINEVVSPKQPSPVVETTVSPEGEHIEKKVSPAPYSAVTVGSDEEDDRYQKSFLPSSEVALPKKPPPAVKMTEYQAPIACCEEIDDLNFESSLAGKGNNERDKTMYVGVPEELHDQVDTEDEESPIACSGEGEDMNFETSLAGKGDTKRDEVDYVGVPNEQDDQVDTEDEELDDIWTEMSMGIECSKDVSVNLVLDEESKKDEDCDHSFVLKDDLGYVCRVCGLIDRGIETIFEFQYKAKRTSRTYVSESHSASTSEKISTQILQGGLKNSAEELMPNISVHPRHMKQMKPHQVDGFNFLCSNLTVDNPGGCILAHAPGSGKTFLIISFMQSFLARSPNARPLVVLPKGILATWKKEFQTWQVEDIPLYDFYTVKADNRAKQLSVLKKWVEHKSVLFLGYQQFSTIIRDDGTESKECQKILLKVPTILVLDEGHTPRNEETDVLQSLARVQTPLKVVLSGTLYQNHVKEVFNILKLVRPKFMKSQTSREIQRRIMSRVHISRMRNPSKDGSDLAFFELVEKALQQKDDLQRKAAVIQDLREMTSKVLHYYKGDFLDELPGLVDYTLLLNLSSAQKSEVEKLKYLDHFKRTAVGSLLYVHPQLKSFSEKFSSNGEKGSSISDNKMDAMVKEMSLKIGAKTKFFVNMLKLCQSAGEKLLVFSQYILPLKLFERLSIKLNGWRRDKELFMLTGDSSYEQRECSMERFNNSPDAKVFFGSIKACGEGISLVGASRIIILDVHLNPSVTRQAIGRAFRPGQKKKVYTYRLVAADSPEEEDHNTCYRKELIAKMWFEWNENCRNQQFEMKTIDVDECDDPFLESLSLREDIKTLYKR